MYTIASLVLVALAVHGTAAVNLSPELFHGHTRAALQLRQTIDPGEIPTQCQSQCAVAVQALNGCADLTCLCTTRVNTGLTTCFNCILPLSTDADGSLHQQSQQSVSSYEDTCKAGGFPLPSLTISGATPPITSSPSSGSSTISVTFAPTSTITAGIPASASATASASASSTDTDVFSIPPQSESTIVRSTVSAPIERSTVGPGTSSTASLSSPASASQTGGTATGGNGAAAVRVPTLAAFIAVVVGFVGLLV